jgi:hypothetical protein
MNKNRKCEKVSEMIDIDKIYLTLSQLFTNVE